ncbi:MAG: ComEC/Rec2 family competence protein [Christensenellales bacterium]
MAKKKNNGNKTKYRFTKVGIITFLVLSILLTVFAFVFKKPIEEILNKNNVSTIIDYDGLVMHTIDVGQAEAIMIKLPDGKNMLVDSGNKGTEKNEKLKSYLVNNYFSSVQNKEIDYFVITHSDADHTGGAVMIFDEFQVNKVFRPNLFSDVVESEQSIVTSYDKKYVESYKENWANVIQKMYAEPNCEIEFSKAGIEIVESTYSIKFCAPTEDNYSNVNSYSPIIVIEYSSRKIMLTGDATTQTEKKALENLSHCDILKVAHHGSLTSTSVEFLEKVNPNYAIISANKNDHNNYDLPSKKF